MSRCRRLVGVLAAALCVSAVAVGHARYALLRSADGCRRALVARYGSASDLSPLQKALVAELVRQTGAGIRYQSGYYAGGEPPANIGVCSDVIIRAMRAAGVDLRRAMAEDVRDHRDAYGIAHPDPNIDHRRCRYLLTFFRRHALDVRPPPGHPDWQPGDVVFWCTRGSGAADHVAMVALRQREADRPLVVQHLPGFPVMCTRWPEQWRVLGHFRWRA